MADQLHLEKYIVAERAMLALAIAGLLSVVRVEHIHHYSYVQACNQLECHSLNFVVVVVAAAVVGPLQLIELLVVVVEQQQQLVIEQHTKLTVGQFDRHV